MEEYLKNHPLINITSIEKALGYTHGVLRKGKPIPGKYRESVARLLRSYGYDSGAVKEKPAEVIKTTTGSKYFTRLGKEGVYICYRDGIGIVRLVKDIADNTSVTLG